MGKPYQIELTDGYGRSEGIILSYTQRTRSLHASAWFDTFVGFDAGSLTLAELFRQLHIPPAHIRAALKELEHG